MEESEGGEISTLDGVADVVHHRYLVHIHSSVGTPGGGNVVIVDRRWLTEMSHGVYCSSPTDQETDEVNADLARPSIDPILWWSRLREGESSPTIAVTRYLGSFYNTNHFPQAVVHRLDKGLDVTFADDVPSRMKELTFSDFGTAPAVVVPPAKPCPPRHPSGD